MNTKKAMCISHSEFKYKVTMSFQRIALIKNIFASAEENKLATESMYIFWIDLMVELGDTSEAMKCLYRALEMYKQNASLWKTYLLLKAGGTGKMLY